MLTERLVQNLPKLPQKEWLMTKGRQLVSSIKITTTKWGLFGLLLIIMVIFSGLKLLWSSNFPIGWWILMGLILIAEVLKDKNIWPEKKENVIPITTAVSNVDELKK